jgi:hypothetical protein
MREIHDKRRRTDPPDPNGLGQRWRFSLLLSPPAVIVLPVPPMSVCIVPLARIKAKKIPIVQPNLTFGHKKSGQKKFYNIFQ